MPAALGEQIKSLRERAGLTQEQLADRVRVSSHTIRNWEKGITSPTVKNMTAIARALGVNEADLMALPGLGRRQSTANPSAQGEGMDVETFNSRGRIEDLRSPGVKPLPIYRWGAMGDPRDEFSAPFPDRLEYPPLGREHLVGPNGFAVEVRGTSMVGRDLQDGDVCWINPDRAYRLGDLVLALVTDGDGDAGMVIKTYAHTDVGYGLVSETDSGRSTVVCREFKIIGPVVLVQRVFPPR